MSTRILAARKLTAVDSRPVEWLWSGRLSLGKLSLLEGDPNLGKSLVTLDLCARLTTGRPMPDGGPGLEPCNVIVLNAEDNVADTIRPRLAGLGADLERIFTIDAGEHNAPVRLPDDLEPLDALLAETQSRLVVVDPLPAFLGGSVRCDNEQAMRRVLQPLGQLAGEHGCAMLLVRHLNKQSSRALYRGYGSIAILGWCRSVWLIAADPDEPSRRVLAQQKSNLGPPQPSLAYTIEPGPDGKPVVVWSGTSRYTTDKLLAPQRRGPAPSARRQAEDLLADLLRDGPRPTTEIWDALRELGATYRTVMRAKRELGIRGRCGIDQGIRRHYWLLPGQTLKLPKIIGEPPKEVFEDLFKDVLERQLGKPAPPTPLDAQKDEEDD